MTMLETVHQSDRPLSLRATLAPLQRGAGDPCVRWHEGSLWRVTRTPEGPATQRLTQLDDRSVRAQQWGAGAEWLVDHLAELLGEHQLDGEFHTDHPAIQELHRHAPGLRIPRTRNVYEAMLPTILEQRVTGMEAKRSYRRIAAQCGDATPASVASAPLLRLPPTPERLAALPYWWFHRFGVERKRADALRSLGTAAGSLQRSVDMEPADGHARLTAVPGIGPWTAAVTASIALGDADAAIVGDFHIPNFVAWTLADEPRADDARMLELLEPFSGQRGRVTRLIMSSGKAPPKYGPRYNPIPIASL
jgi:3-methyladenine DNA glycosylase/8-oxoguanine DNA glycosylase